MRDIGIDQISWNEQIMHTWILRFPGLMNLIPEDCRRGFNPESLDRWGAEESLEPALKYIAQFLLMIWDPYREWLSGKFDFTAAFLDMTPPYTCKTNPGRFPDPEIDYKRRIIDVFKSWFCIPSFVHYTRS